MKKLFFKRKRNNSGSTIVIVLLMTSFVLILSTLITTTTMVNLRMKINASQATKSFYTAEEAVDEIYAALGKTSMQSFNGAYEEQLTRLYSNSSITTSSGTVKVDNDKANINLRDGYIERLIKEFDISWDKTSASKKWDSTNDTKSESRPVTERDKFVSKLNDSIEGYDGTSSDNALKVKSISTLSVTHATTTKKGDSTESSGSVSSVNLPIYTLKFTDCVVEYKDEKTGNYSYITFDGKVELPDIYVDFVRTEPAGTVFFADFALIGNTGVALNNASSVNINGNTYAGSGKGFVSSESTGVEFNSDYLICGGKMDFQGHNTFTLGSGSELWAEDIYVGSSDSITMNGYVFVSDDTTVNGVGSTINYNGYYEGFGSAMQISSSGTIKEKGTHTSNSSVIINGDRSTIDFSLIKRLVIAGNAYINYALPATEPYPTGESYSENVNQDIYMVPAKLIKTGSNPSKEGSVFVADIKSSNFFAWNLLAASADSSQPTYITEKIPEVITKADGTETTITREYHYLNFKDAESRNRYAEIILDDDEFKAYMGSSYSENSSESQLRNQIKDSRIDIGSSFVWPSSSYRRIIFSKTNDSSDVQKYFSNVMDDRARRYTVFCKMLKPLGDSAKNCELDTTSDKYLSDKSAQDYLNSEQNGGAADLEHYIELDNFRKNDIFYNIINETGKDGFNELLEIGTEASGSASKSVEISDDKQVIIVNAQNLNITNGSSVECKNNTLTLPASDNHIVVCNGNVVIESGTTFNGIIIAKGVINVESNVTVKDGYTEDTFKAALNSAGKKIANVFRYWNSSKDESKSTSVNVADMTYKQMVSFDQWRKYEYEAE